MIPAVCLAVALVASAAPTAEVEKEVMKFETDWFEAVVKNDAAHLERIYADDYLTVETDGTVMDKAQDLKNFRAGGFKLESYALYDVKVRVYGDVAVVTGGALLRVKERGKDSAGRFRFTDVVAKKDGRWRVVSVHNSKDEVTKADK